MTSRTRTDRPEGRPVQTIPGEEDHAERTAQAGHLSDDVLAALAEHSVERDEAAREAASAWSVAADAHAARSLRRFRVSLTVEVGR